MEHKESGNRTTCLYIQQHDVPGFTRIFKFSDNPLGSVAVKGWVYSLLLCEYRIHLLQNFYFFAIWPQQFNPVFSYLLFNKMTQHYVTCNGEYEMANCRQIVKEPYVEKSTIFYKSCPSILLTTFVTMKQK